MLWECNEWMSKPYHSERLEQFFLTSIDLYFKDIDLPARISIQFSDDSSYEFLIYFNYHDLTLKYNEWSFFLENL